MQTSQWLKENIRIFLPHLGVLWLMRTDGLRIPPYELCSNYDSSSGGPQKSFLDHIVLNIYR